MKNKMTRPASEFVKLARPQQRNTLKKLVKLLTQFYGRTRSDLLLQHRNIVKNPQRSSETFLAFINRQMANFVTLNANDRYNLLRFSLRDEYNEELRRRDVQSFDEALSVLMAFDKARPQQASATIAATVPAEPPLTLSSINALFDQRFVRFNEVVERLKALETTVQGLMSNQQAQSAVTGPQKWCSHHKVNTHDDSDCFVQKNKARQAQRSYARESVNKTSAKK